MKVPIPTFFQRMIARFWAAVLFICFFPVFVVLVLKFMEKAWPFVYGGLLLIIVMPHIARAIRRRRNGWPED